MAIDRRHETLADRKVRQCVHFTGIQNKVCAAGVAYESVRDTATKPFGFPCLEEYAGNAACAQLRRHTREEAEAEEAEFQAVFQRVNACVKAIREKHGKARGLNGEMPCPTQCGGTLRYSIAAYNGHVHGQCSTDGCARWMQ